MRRACVLVVDDDQAVRETLEVALSVAGFEVITADRGTSAIEAAKHGAVSVVITDLTMPGMSGLETLAALKEQQPSLPVIVITGFASGGTTTECSALGAFGFLEKPFKLEELYGLVRHALHAASPSNR